MAVQNNNNAVLDAMIRLMELELIRHEEEQDGIAQMVAQLGARLMGVLEDGLDIEDDPDASWEKVDVDLDGYRRMGDPSFRRHFRLTKPTYELLIQRLATHLIDSERVQRVRNGLDIPLLMVLWVLANPDTFRSVALRFGVLPGTVHFHYSYMIEALRELAPQYIKWPDEDERAIIKARFLAYSGLPGIVGVIDGTYNTITAPLVQKDRFRNRHDQFSLNSMVVCDHRLLIRDLHVGEAGNLHDQRVLRRSPLYRRLLRDDGNQLIREDEHIIGDGAYEVMKFLMVPFRNTGNLTREQRRFNYCLSRCRARIEHTFAKAFGQWRRMKHLHSLNMELAVDHIVACFVLQNFSILNGEILLELEDYEDVPWFGDEEDDFDEDAINEQDVIEMASRAEGLAKRLQLVNDIVWDDEL